MESTAMGLLSGINAFRYANGGTTVVPPPTTAIGSLVRYISHSPAVPFQPMNINFGLLPPLPVKGKGKGTRLLLARRALSEMDRWKREIEE